MMNRRGKKKEEVVAILRTSPRRAQIQKKIEAVTQSARAEKQVKQISSLMSKLDRMMANDK